VIGPIPARLMPMSVWNKLPKEIQEILDGDKEWWSLEAAREVEKADAVGLETAKAAGIEFIQLPQAEVDKFNTLYETELLKSAKALDDKGLPGTKFYEDVRRLIKQMGQ
jgi:TRAP-type C4-dicarboxylate transport system substrate-binding protein